MPLASSGEISRSASARPSGSPSAAGRSKRLTAAMESRCRPPKEPQVLARAPSAQSGSLSTLLLPRVDLTGSDGGWPMMSPEAVSGRYARPA
eukprot:6311735-Prymnesium_polylepis.1